MQHRSIQPNQPLNSNSERSSRPTPTLTQSSSSSTDLDLAKLNNKSNSTSNDSTSTSIAATQPKSHNQLKGKEDGATLTRNPDPFHPQPLESSESTPDSSPSTSAANVKAWLNDQNERENGTANPTSTLSSTFNSQQQNSIPTTSSTPAPPPRVADNQEPVLPPIQHGIDVWNQLYEAMHNENQKLRNRLAVTERKAESFRRENVHLKEKVSRRFEVP